MQLIQELKPPLKGGMAAKRARMPITNFETVAGDPEPIMKVLTWKCGKYEDFIKALSQDDFKKFANHCMKQKNMDRNLDYVISNLQMRIEYEDRFPIFSQKSFPRFSRKSFPRFSRKSFPRFSRKSFPRIPKFPFGKPLN